MHPNPMYYNANKHAPNDIVTNCMRIHQTQPTISMNIMSNSNTHNKQKHTKISITTKETTDLDAQGKT